LRKDVFYLKEKIADIKRQVFNHLPVAISNFGVIINFFVK